MPHRYKYLHRVTKTDACYLCRYNTCSTNCRRLRWLGRLSSCLLKSISRVQFSPSAHTRRDFFLHKKKWLTESTRGWVHNIGWKSTSSGNAEPHARKNLKARTGGEKGRHLWPLLVQKVAEGKTSCELSWKVKVKTKTGKVLTPRVKSLLNRLINAL